jgi:hypothetical protein
MSYIHTVWLKSLAYPSGEEGGNFLVQIIFTCRTRTRRGRGEGSAASLAGGGGARIPESYDSKKAWYSSILLFYAYMDPKNGSVES